MLILMLLFNIDYFADKFHKSQTLNTRFNNTNFDSPNFDSLNFDISIIIIIIF